MPLEIGAFFIGDIKMWKPYPKTPPSPCYHPDAEIRAFPVAFIYDDQVTIDFAEYDPNRFSLAKTAWHIVGDTIPVHPFAWFDLPELPRILIPPNPPI